jgi:signal transduction histidine kinase/CheY-like chemotaxis protein
MPGLWQRLPFAGRLLVTASVALLVAGLAMVGVSARQEAEDAKEELGLVLAQELETLPAALAEVVVIGDYATLQQTLDRYVVRPLLVVARYRDNRGVSVESRDVGRAAAAPDWFLRLFRYQELRGEARVAVGGREYGRLTLEISPQLPADRAWRRLLQHMAILLLAVAVDFVGIWLVLHFGLRPLKRLEAGTEAIAAGRLDTRLESSGSPELRHLIDSFNRMAGAIQHAQAELRDYKGHLEELVARRTEELHQALAVAESASRAKSRFLANMSHELRTPLNAILGFAQIMDRDPSLDIGQHRQLATIHRSGRHLLALINDVLEIARIEAGRTRVEVAPFDLDETLAAIAEMIRVRAEAQGLSLRVDRSGDLPTYVLGDAHHLRQVLINLLGNAVKFTDQGVITLRVAAQGDRVRFAVSDTGPGIPAQEQARIFEAFYQTDQGAATGEGTGLGLTISREFVRLMGGELSVESVPGQGSTFSFEIPLAATEMPLAGPAHRLVVGLEPGQPAYRILVAEDKEDNRELALRLLEAVGFEVRSVENGTQAVELFQAWQPDFIWMDMRMPVLDGYAATRAIRRLPGGQRVKIAALTASAFQEDRDAILAAGCDEMVRKPIEEGPFFEVMSRLLGVRFRHAAPAETATTAGSLDLSPLSAQQRGELREAALLMDLELARRVVGRIRTEHPAVAEGIDELVESFRFDLIAERCGLVS